jgi:hypothetical protein
VDHPTLEQMLAELYQYLRVGEAYLRRSQASVVAKVLRSVRRLGCDALRATDDLISDFKKIQRLARQIHQAWILIVLRCLFIVISAIILRVFFERVSHPQASTEMILFDRIFMATAILCLLILSSWLFYRYLNVGWNDSRQRSLWFYFKAYLGVGDDSTVCRETTAKLRQMMQEGLRAGVDVRPARAALLRGQIASMHERLESELRSMSTLATGVELVVYALGYLGFVGAPLLMWLESASGLE